MEPGKRWKEKTFLTMLKSYHQHGPLRSNDTQMEDGENLKQGLYPEGTNR